MAVFETWLLLEIQPTYHFTDPWLWEGKASILLHHCFFVGYSFKWQIDLYRFGACLMHFSKQKAQQHPESSCLESSKPAFASPIFVGKKHNLAGVNLLFFSKECCNKILVPGWSLSEVIWVVATQICLEFSPRNLGKKFPILTHIFQRGWNHQLVIHWWLFCFWEMSTALKGVNDQYHPVST